MKMLIIVPMIFAIIPILYLTGCGEESETLSEHPDIVLIIIDTIRPDHMSVNGYFRETTPVLDSLASRGTIWTRFQGQSGWTLPATATILTGLSQRAHGAGCSDGNFYGIDPILPTIPHLVRRGAGYQTAGFFNLFFLSEDFGFHNGFDYFDCTEFSCNPQIRNAEETVNDYLVWYDENRDSSRPLLSVIHFFDPHLPYCPPSPWDSLYADPKADAVFNRHWGSMNDVLAMNQGFLEMDSIQLEIMTGLYDSELSFTDNQIGRLISELGLRGTLANTVFIITGDQGEELLDHGGFGHGHSLYQEILNVPLIVCGRGIPVGISDEIAAHIDLLPTVLGIAGLDTPIWADGMDILNPDAGRAARYIQSSNLLWATPDLAAVRLENRIVIGNPQEVSPSLYDLHNDPLERNPLVPGRETVDQLFYYWSLSPNGQPEAVTFGGKTIMRLRELGYTR